MLASLGFSFYVRHFGSYEAVYGALGGVIVFLLWMWISALVILIGAEINAVLEHASPEGKRKGAKSMADTAAEPARGRSLGRPPGAIRGAGVLYRRVAAPASGG